MQIQRTFSGASWETKVGYCRAIKIGNQIYISGTAPIDTDEHPPASSMIEIKSLVDPDMLIEIEAEAIIQNV
jgi:enamine deaminase RidA (YjgF/YER057c/UK114 family)